MLWEMRWGERENNTNGWLTIRHESRVQIREILMEHSEPEILYGRPGPWIRNLAIMRVLIACEFSGIVRDAFLARGHDA